MTRDEGTRRRSRPWHRAAIPALFAAAACTAPADDPALAALRSARGEPTAGTDAAAFTSDGEHEAPEFAALDLAAALRHARERRPELAVLRAELAAAHARAQGAGRFPDPTLIARVEAAPLADGGIDDADWLAGVAQPLPLSDRRAAERGVAQAERSREAARGAALLRRVEDDVRRAFATALFAQHAAHLHGELARHARALREPVEARAAAGDATAGERARAALAEREAAAAAAVAQRAAALARSDLAIAIGSPDAAIDAVAGALDDVLALPDLAAAVERLGRHPALAMAHADEEVAAAALALAREERIPDLEVELLYRRIGAEDLSALDVGLSLPLRLHGAARARVTTAQAQRDAATARARAAGLELSASLRAAHARLAAALDRRDSLRSEVLPLHDELVRVEQARLAAGDARIEALVTARTERTRAEVDLLDATRDALEAWGELCALAPEPLALGTAGR